MSTCADFLNTLPPHERDVVISMMKEGKLFLCDSVVEVMSVILQMSVRRKEDA